VQASRIQSTRALQSSLKEHQTQALLLARRTVLLPLPLRTATAQLQLVRLAVQKLLQSLRTMVLLLLARQTQTSREEQQRELARTARRQEVPQSWRWVWRTGWRLSSLVSARGGRGVDQHTLLT
jgi:hypothetical protein